MTTRPTVAVIAVPGLLWSDLPAMPALRGLAARGADANLVVKTAQPTTSCLAGSLSFSAGNRTTATGSGCLPRGVPWATLARQNRDSRFGARIGALGTALRQAGLSRSVLDGAAYPMLADERGRVATSSRPSGQVTAYLDTGLDLAATGGRQRAAAEVDSRVRGVLAMVPAGAVVIVAGTSDGPTDGAHLHPLVVAGPGWAHRQLSSPTTGRPGYVQLIDLAPTVLAELDIAAPSGMVGRPAHLTGARVPDATSYLGDDRHARAAPSLALRGTLTWLAFALVVLAQSRLVRVRQFVPWLARVLAPAPVLSYLVNLLPWWRWGDWSFGVLLAAGCIAVAAVTTALVRRRRWLAIALVPVLSVVVLVMDQLAGAPMQLAAPLGDNPITAGRFTGIGNLAFAVLATGALLAAGVLPGRLPRWRSVAAAAGLLLLANFVDIAPPLGDDFGGALSFVPAAAVLLALVAGIRLTARRVLLVAAGTVVVAVALALADYARPPARQTHIGRFVGQVLHGGAGTVLHRKADAVLATVGPNPATFLVLVTAAGLWWRREEIRRAAAAVPGLSAGIVATAVVAVVGTVLNDSGLTVAAMVITVAAAAGLGGLTPSGSAASGRRSPLPAPPREPGAA